MHQDLEQLSFADNEFDIVVSSEVLEHVSDYNKCFKEIHRVLKEGGVMLYYVPFYSKQWKTYDKSLQKWKGKHNSFNATRISWWSIK